MDDLVVTHKPDPIHCHHADVIAYIHGLEIELSLLRQESKRHQELLVQHQVLLEQGEEKCRWLLENRQDIETVINGSKWVSLTRRVIIFVAGTIIGLLTFWHSFKELIQSHLGKAGVGS